MKAIVGLALLVAACGGQGEDTGSRLHGDESSDQVEQDAGAPRAGDLPAINLPPITIPGEDQIPEASDAGVDLGSGGEAAGGQPSTGGASGGMGGSEDTGGAGGAGGAVAVAGSGAGGQPVPSCDDVDADGVCDTEDDCLRGPNADDDANGFIDACEEVVWGESLVSPKREWNTQSVPQGSQFRLNVLAPDYNSNPNSCYRQTFALMENEVGTVTHLIDAFQAECISSERGPEAWGGNEGPKSWSAGIFPLSEPLVTGEPPFQRIDPPPTHAVAIVTKNEITRNGSEILTTEYAVRFEFRRNVH